MVHPSLIEARLDKLGFRASRWFRAEINELQHILMHDEEIVSLVCGRYFGSFALLVATDQRLLIIDKRVFFMTIEDIRYDMVSEIDFNMQVYTANMTVYTMNKTHKFSSIKYKGQMRELATYTQRRVWELRQMLSVDSTPSAQAQTSFIPVPQLRPFNSRQPQPFLPPQPISAQPSDYYADHPVSDSRQIRERVGHVAHLVGSAATKAAHSPHIHHRPFNPYLTGSLMTRRPMGSSDY
jgi:hypothetical protein